MVMLGYPALILYIIISQDPFNIHTHRTTFQLRPSSSMNGSLRLSVRPSVCLSVTPFLLCSHYRIIMKFSGVITNDRSDVHPEGQGQRSKVKVTEVETQLSGFRTITPV